LCALHNAIRKRRESESRANYGSTPYTAPTTVTTPDTTNKVPHKQTNELVISSLPEFKGTETTLRSNGADWLASLEKDNTPYLTNWDLDRNWETTGPYAREDTPTTPDTTNKGSQPSYTIPEIKDYSSTVKYLRDNGVQDTSGIKTRLEWLTGGTRVGDYQDYLLSASEKILSSNSDTPAFDYEYYKSREEALRPIMEEIANDADRTDEVFRAWADNYANDENWQIDNPALRAQAMGLYSKFKYQDEILDEYQYINSQIQKFDKQGVHYDDNLEIDAKSGANEAKYNKERLDHIIDATTFTNDELILGYENKLPENRQKEYDDVFTYGQKSNIEASKEEAYNYYEKNKDNVYENNKRGRFAGNYKIGRIGIKSNSAGYTSFNATSDDIEASEVYQILASRIQNRNAETFKNNGGTDELIAIIGQYAPQGVDQAIIGTIGQIVGTLAIKSGNVGRATATASYMFEQTAGATYVRLLQESDLSVEDAKALASSEALSSAIVEFGLDYATSKLWSTVGSKVNIDDKLTKVGNKLTKGLTSIGIPEKGAKLILNTAKNAGRTCPFPPYVPTAAASSPRIPSAWPGAWSITLSATGCAGTP